MELGREIVACVLRTGSIRPFIEAGINRDWLSDRQDLSSASILGEAHRDPYEYLLGYWERHRKLPSVDIFRMSYPEDAYELPDSDRTPDELTEIVYHARRKYLVDLTFGDLSDMVEAAQRPSASRAAVDAAIEFMEQSLRIIRDVHVAGSLASDWDDKEYELEARIGRNIVDGVKTGIKGLDDQFAGFQPGNLICYLGRAKASKTSLALLSSLRAWMDDRRVLFVTFEIAAGKDPKEPGVADRLDCFGAGIDYVHYAQGKLTPGEERKLRRFRDECVPGEGAFRIIQPTGKYTIADLEADIERHQPDVVYIDGFYFMFDVDTGKAASHWQAHDNLAGDLKTLAMTHSIPVIITHQVREKQLSGKPGKGIDDGAMMGGTAIIMFADMVLGVDVDEDGLRTISCTRSRLKYLDTIYGKWNWEDCTFIEQASPTGVDPEKFAGNREAGHGIGHAIEYGTTGTHSRPSAVA